MAGNRTRGTTSTKPLALAGASSRLQMLERAGLTPERCSELVRKFLEQAEAAMTSAMNPLVPTEPDYHARLRAGQQLMALIGANPPKTSASSAGGPQVVVINEVPEWAKPAPVPARAKVIEVLPGKPA